MTVSAPNAFVLPPANEANTTPERRGITRDGVRLLVTDRSSGTSHDAAFLDLPAFLRPGDLLVANDSATIPAALRARHGDGTPFTLHLSTRIGDDLWIAEPRALAPPIAPGERVTLAARGNATFLAPVDDAHPRLWYARISVPQPIGDFLAEHGAPIRYAYAAQNLPLADYQTVFARVRGSAEMPSAGRPFTSTVLDDLHDAGVALATITLHTGVSSPELHERPYREQYAVPAATASAVNDTRRRGGRVVAIGTTVVRALESSVTGGTAIASAGWTDLIVTPDHPPVAVDALLTGFHEPQASHLDMLRSFTTAENLATAYAHALQNGYLWHEFGDLHLLL